jgi:hypothetical protein
LAARSRCQTQCRCRPWDHAYRAAGGDRDYCDSRRFVFAGLERGQEPRASDQLHGWGKAGTCEVPAGVASLYPYAFSDCTNLAGVYFKGNAPDADTSVFAEATNLTVYYLPATTGWDSTFGDRPTALWVLPYPVILTTAPNFGIQTYRFGFVISWATNAAVVVEASANLGTWLPLATNTLTGGWSYFSDPEWANHPARLYRIRLP